MRVLTLLRGQIHIKDQGGIVATEDNHSVNEQYGSRNITDDELRKIDNVGLAKSWINYQTTEEDQHYWAVVVLDDMVRRHPNRAWEVISIINDQSRCHEYRVLIDAAIGSGPLEFLLQNCDRLLAEKIVNESILDERRRLQLKAAYIVDLNLKSLINESG